MGTVTTKQFGLGAVNETVQLGKDGHVIDGTSVGHITLKKDNGDLINVKGAASTASDEFVTGAQLDAVHALAGGYLAYGYDASAAISQLASEGSGAAGAIRYGDTYKVTVEGTFLGATAHVGDMVTALVTDADTTDNTASNTDWLMIEIKTAKDLADGISTDFSGGKLIVKDSGISTVKLADDAVTLAKMADESVDSDQYVDGSIDTVHIANGAVIDEKITNDTITESKLATSVKQKLAKAVTEYDTRTPNFEAAVGGSFDADTNNSIAAQTNYLTTTTITSQLGQADARMKLDNDDNALRKVTASHDGGAQHIGASIKSGRVVLSVHVTPLTVANGANCTMSVGISGDSTKYVAIADIDLYAGSPSTVTINRPLAADEQLIATVSQGTATAGSFLVTVQHG